jgi:phospholipid/cholesterol/gamma-HCH transport system ATP-binding protein
LSASAPEIRVKALHKTFAEHEVLKGVDVTLQAGRVNFVIGRSGGGKSVLLKHLTGLLSPDSGEIWYGDREISRGGSRGLKELRRKMGLLFQEGALFDSLSVTENVSFPPWYHGTMRSSEIARKVRTLLSELGMEGREDARVSELSGGERKRVALARAIIMEPQVVFFDEPTTGLDPILSTQVDSLILNTRDRTGATCVVVSHDIAAVLSIADQVSLIHEGKMILTGTPKDFRDSTIPVVREFISGGEEQPEAAGRPSTSGSPARRGSAGASGRSGPAGPTVSPGSVGVSGRSVSAGPEGRQGVTGGSGPNEAARGSDPDGVAGSSDSAGAAGASDPGKAAGDSEPDGVAGSSDPGGAAGASGPCKAAGGSETDGVAGNSDPGATAGVSGPGKAAGGSEPVGSAGASGPIKASGGSDSERG